MLAMHLETLLYMLLQTDKTRPPTATIPDFAGLAAQADDDAVAYDWFQIPASTLSVGLNDPEIDEGPDRYFGWDNEKPRRNVHVNAFEAKGRPITNGEYASFLEQTASVGIPATWTQTSKSDSAEEQDIVIRQPKVNGHTNRLPEMLRSPKDTFLNGKFVRTMYGGIPLRDALSWPVSASYDELSACAQWMGGRVPTAEEVQSIYRFAELTKEKEVAGILTRKISAVNG